MVFVPVLRHPTLTTRAFSSLARKLFLKAQMSENRNNNPNAMEEDYSSESDSSSDEDERHPDAYKGNEEVQVDFEGRSPIDPNCHGISQLLSRLFLKAHIDTMQLADMIIAQNFVGSVIAQCDSDGMESDADDDMCDDGTIFGITTVLNMTAKKEKTCIEQLRTYLLQKAEKHATDAAKADFRKVLGDDDTQQVGFLINERFINIPPQISVPLLENLSREIDAAKGKGMKFDFTHFLMIVKLFRRKPRKGKPAEDTYTNAEEEAICTHALNSFEFSVADECDMGVAGDWLESDRTLTPYRKVIILNAKDLPSIIENIKKFIEE